MGFLGPWGTIFSYIVGVQTAMYVCLAVVVVVGGGGRKPKFPSRYLPKIDVSISDYPNFSFRQLPWDSVDYHRHIYCRHEDNNVWATLYPIRRIAQLRRNAPGSPRLPIYFLIQTARYLGGDSDA